MASNSISVSANLDPALGTAESNYLAPQNLCVGYGMIRAGVRSDSMIGVTKDGGPFDAKDLWD